MWPPSRARSGHITTRTVSRRSWSGGSEPSRRDPCSAWTRPHIRAALDAGGR
jgi:hypothetical protein